MARYYTRLEANTFRRFPRLPAEIRCRIWFLAGQELLDGPSQVSLNQPHANKLAKAGILTACRESQHEVESLYYKNRVFVFDAVAKSIPVREAGMDVLA